MKVEAEALRPYEDKFALVGKRKNEAPSSVVNSIWSHWAKNEADMDDDPAMDQDDPDLIAKKGELETESADDLGEGLPEP